MYNIIPGCVLCYFFSQKIYKYYHHILQVKEVAQQFFGIKVAMKMEKQEVVFDTVVTSFDMKFENKVFIAAQELAAKMREASMPIRAAILFEMFPFCILFGVNVFL